MNIIYFHQYFKTPQEPGGTRSYWIARRLIEEGHNVHMISAKASVGKSVEVENIEGINVTYLKIPYDNKMSIPKRVLSFFKYMIRATGHAWKLDGMDMVIATSTPLTVGFPALVLKKFKRIPYLFEVRDLWPEVPIQMGGLKNPLLIKLAKWFEKSIYKNARYIVALSPGMYDGVLSQDISPDKVFMIPNMAKIDEFYPRAKNTSLMQELGINPDSFKIIHFGALGIANGVQSIIDGAELLKGRDDIEFIFIGGGSTESKFMEYCREKNITNVKFLGRYPMDLTSEIVNLCDVSIVSFLDLPILYTNSPNKLFDSLSAGKPIIVNSAGWTKDLVEEHKCGYYVNPHKPEELADKIMYLRDHPEVADGMGRNARELAVNKYDKSILCEQFNEVVSLFSK